MKRPSVLSLSLTLLLVAAVHARAETFVPFESGHVRPLALVPDADLLIAVNEPAARISIFAVTAAGLSLAAEVPVGLEPVAVATRTLSSGRVEAWVVNHVSDSVSIVEIDPSDVAAARVKRTLLVGDEPRDIVFAGASGSRAFITTAHRGQHRPGDPQPFVPGVGRADVWVFDADAPGDPLGGTPVTIVTLFGDTPRALAVSPDGQTVYAAVFRSGNGTSSIHSAAVTANGGLPPPPIGATPNGPRTGLIVKKDASTGVWKDELGRDWSGQVPFGLPDLDVFAIDAIAAVPVESGAVAGVGTVLLAMATRPGTGTLFVGNLEARNEVRFEPVLRGDLGQNRITVVSGSVATPVHLNPHIDYGTIPGPPGEVEESLAFPTGLAFSPDGQTLFVAALGSDKIFALDADQLEVGNPSPRAQLAVGGGPTGLVLDAARDRLYVMNRVDHAIAIVANASSPARALAGSVAVGWDPTPAAINAGRRFLYDARRTSAHGDAACATCHVFADTDELAWDLGDPFGPVLVIAGQPALAGNGAARQVRYHPLKGPLLTQSLRGLRDAGPLHWRGDRSAAASGGDPFDVIANLATFNGTFPGLLGADPLAPSDMQAFAEFVAALRYPPNPYRALDDVPTAPQAAGEQIFRTRIVDAESVSTGRGCATCHDFPLSTSGAILPEPASEMKIPHLRNQYQKVGRFGAVANDHAVPPYVVGDQVRGFGLQFDGSLGSLVDFQSAFVPFGFTSAERVPVAEYVLAFDTGLKPIVGEQVTVGAASIGDAAVLSRIALLVARDDASDCDLVAHGRVGSTRAGWRHEGAGVFAGGTGGAAATSAQLLAVAAIAGQEITFTCAPPRNGRRFGNDADEDLVLNDDEIAAGSDPYDASSVPASFAVVPVATQKLVFIDGTSPPRGPANPAKRKLTFVSSTRTSPPANRIVPPAQGSGGDPRLHGALLVVYNPDTGEEAVVELPASGWTAKGSAARPKGFQYKSLAPDGPVKQVLVINDKITIAAGKSQLKYTLDERAQRRLALRLVLGDGVQWCTGAIAGKSDQTDKFVGLATAPPAACVPF